MNNHLPKKKKIAFFKNGSYSQTNKSIAYVLKTAFPEYELVEIEVQDLVPKLTPVNFFYMMMEYGLSILQRKKGISYYSNRTSYYYFKVKKEVRRFMRSTDDFAFSFQTQSLYDASVPEIPHFVYTDHCHLALTGNQVDFSSELLPIWWLELEEEVYQNASRVFCMSSNITQAMRHAYPLLPSKVTTLFPGSNLNLGTIPEPKRKGAVSILYVSRFWKRKGGPLLLKAFLKLKKRCPEVKLHIVGCQPDIREEGVEVLGKVPMQRLAELMSTSAVYCIPHEKEPFSISFMDAMRFGLPIVLTHSGLKPDFVQNGINGYAVRHGDADLLSRCLENIVTDPEQQRELGKASYRMYRKYFNWQATADNLREEVKQFFAGCQKQTVLTRQP